MSADHPGDDRTLIDFAERRRRQVATAKAARRESTADEAEEIV